MPRIDSLCDTCRHRRDVVSGKGSRFLLCRLSQTDKRFAKYPPQPVRHCPGYEAEPAAAAPDNPSPAP
jgi:hypothetical protein